MAKIVILGAGVMGSAMTVPAAARGHDVHLVGTHLDEDIIQSVAGNGYHPRLKLALPEAVRPYRWTEFSRAVGDGADLVVLGVSSAGVEWAIDRLVESLPKPIPILMVTKGLAPTDDGIAVLPPLVAAALKDRIGGDAPVMAIAGPSIAGELAATHGTSAVFTGTDPNALEWVTGMFATPYYFPTVDSDVAGIEVCAAFKNFYALAVGSAEGLVEASSEAENAARMYNVAASLFTQALSEMTILVDAIGGRPAAVQGLAGTGDLYVTCQAGRNSRMGRLLGLGLPFSQAKANHMPDDTVEGAELALGVGPTLREMMDDGRLDATAMPVTCGVIDAVCRDQPLTFEWNRFHRH